MFSDELNNIDWDETTQRIYSTTDNDVRRALSKAHCNVDDFMALLSPAAEPYLETMARLSRKYTQATLNGVVQFDESFASVYTDILVSVFAEHLEFIIFLHDFPVLFEFISRKGSKKS